MRRLNRIFAADGKTVIIAMDHGLSLDVLPELADVGTVLSRVISGGADAVLVSYGVAQKYGETLKSTGLIVRLDGGNSCLSNKPGGGLLYSVEDALRLGADGVACMGFPGAENESETLDNLARIAAECSYWQVPLMAEMLPGGFAPEPPNTVENIKLVSRIGAELGAHIIKTTFAGSREEFREVVTGCFVPVVVLGGDQTNDIKGLFKTIEQAVAAGAAGVAVGRNVWKSREPEKVTSALVELVHNQKSADQALALIG